MTSFPDEQPLSRRARRERLRDKQAQNDVLGVAPADADDTAAGSAAGDEHVAPEPDDADAEFETSPGADVAGAAPAGDASARPLTRRERRARMLRDTDTASQPIAAESHQESPAQDEGDSAAATDEAETPSGPARPSPAAAQPKAEQPKGEQATGIGTEETSPAAPTVTAAADAQPEWLRPAAVVDAGERTLADVIAAERDHDDAPQLSPAFGSGIRVEKERESAPPSFDRVIAPEARSSEALTTSSVLILPTGPQHHFPGPVRTTGEILVTGSVDLPSSATDNETHGGVDRTDIDSGLDQNGNVPATAGTPVSATKAVSTHTATRDVITPPAKSANSRLLMILAVTAGILCVAVIGVVIVGLMTGAL